MTPVSRRHLLAAGLGAGVALGLAPGVASAAPGRAGVRQPEIRPRSEWAEGSNPTGPLQEEAPGDVRFLVIHHSESPNSETPASIPGRLRGFYSFHTGTKKWPDVAYNFFVDPFGRIWEGRRGSLAGPVRGDATGGSQGYAQLACFIGDHTRTPPTEEAMQAMSELVAWLADRYAIDLAAGPTIRFTSRGSNRWPEGTEVTTDPVVGHRDMSMTSCPGDALYPLVRSRILPEALTLLRGVEQTTPTPTPTPTPSPEPPAGPRADEPTASASPKARIPTSAGPTATAPGTTPPAPESGGTFEQALPIGVGAAVVAGGAAVAAVVAKRRRS
ncbi:N-acetylmuramoyl-L-alanine amidase [Ammonicoccus fulvus]|uniref:N-acetylmuramoyl-L-alanine amidase n=1 Tax=Ammonicoccus fulvus TaxID=3138240 RepID=A0ABZ3FMJ7_9ACTN